MQRDARRAIAQEVEAPRRAHRATNRSDVRQGGTTAPRAAGSVTDFVVVDILL
jgi:hypothetical protein